ncbi:MAG: HD domain-containing protein [Thermoguttaceae bacterium]
MSNDRLRRRAALEAARMIFTRQETQFGRARSNAVRHLTAAEVDPGDLPTNRDIRGHLQALERAGPDERERLLRLLEAETASGTSAAAGGDTVDRFRAYELLLLPLEHVMQPPEEHPEGDVLYHSLQVFELARQRLPYDEEVLTAALLHDVGKAIDRRDHVAAGLEALDGFVSPRTAWLIEHHADGLMWGEQGAIGARTRRRLEASENFDELMLLAECDRQGRTIGARTCDASEAIDCLRRLSEECGETEA